MNKLTLVKSLNPAYRKQRIPKSGFDEFRHELKGLLEKTDDQEHEEHNKNNLIHFLQKTFYDPDYFVNTKGRTDLVIHNGKDAKSSVGVLIETKALGNKPEMPTTEKLDSKALQELLLYFLRERISEKNLDVRHLIITDVENWFVFDAHQFEKHFVADKTLIKKFEGFESEATSGKNTDFFYKEIASPAIQAMQNDLEFVHFKLSDYGKYLEKENSRKLAELYKFLSPENLLKLPFANDSNTLDKKFYAELLHIMGLEESKVKGKKLIGRKKEKEREGGSLIENTIIRLDGHDVLNKIDNPGQYGSTYDERLFNLALELVIIWMNRILFLKLLEGQLVSFHKGDKSYAFLNIDRIKHYDDLDSLFFQVLARKHEERQGDTKEEFSKVPYLNSSLFETTDIEHKAAFISNLKQDKELSLLSSTVLKDNNGKRRKGKMNGLEYLFAFLDAYDFGSEPGDIVSTENKSIINASVLGLIFEKINGYKDGSFFTPGFITMYMCRETIRRAVVQKFNEVKGWSIETFKDLKNQQLDRTEGNKIINSLKICDPAVGSGHFLVSALNEIIAIKHELGVLLDKEGVGFHHYNISVQNDELTIDYHDEGFKYFPKEKESQRVQETIFNEKKTIIENCLFGVDINPNSVKICRLRLWIELLKSAYYKNDGKLETLPNIDINIKTGNSLISRFALDADLKQALRKSKWNIDSYRLAVSTYRNAESKEQKREMEQLIDEIKSNFETEIETPFKKKIAKARGEVENILTDINTKKLWGDKISKDIRKKLEKATAKLTKLENEREEIKNNKIYENAFEWRFEFPEVLNDEGDFVGFDVVIGNPPYIRQEEAGLPTEYLKQNFFGFSGKADIYAYFIEFGLKISKNRGFLSFITSGKYLQANYGKPLLKHLSNTSTFLSLSDFNDLPVFEEATAYPLITSLINKQPLSVSYNFHHINFQSLPINSTLLSSIHTIREVNFKSFSSNDYKVLAEPEYSLLSKLKENFGNLESVCGLPVVGIKTGLNSAYESTADLSVTKPYLFGKDLKKYGSVHAKSAFIFPYSKDFSLLPEYKIPEQLFDHQDQLSKRAIIKQGLRSGTKKWYEYQQVNKEIFIDKEYIVYPNVSLGNNFTLSKGNLIDMTGFVIKSNSRFILGILNSSLTAYLMKVFCITRRGGYLEYKVQYIKNIPICTPSNNRKNEVESKVKQILALKKENPMADTRVLEAEIDQLVYELYGLSEEEIAIVENAVK